MYSTVSHFSYFPTSSHEICYSKREELTVFFHFGNVLGLRWWDLPSHAPSVTYRRLNIQRRTCCWCQNISAAHVFWPFRLYVPSVPSEQTKSNLKVTSPEDAEHVSRRQASPNGTAPSKGDAKGSRTVPRRHTLGGARGSREILAMQPPDMDKKREAFLEHLKQKYPHHASAIMGHQERLREQVSRLTDALVCNVVFFVWAHIIRMILFINLSWSFHLRDYSKLILKSKGSSLSSKECFSVFQHIVFVFSPKLFPANES